MAYQFVFTPDSSANFPPTTLVGGKAAQLAHLSRLQVAVPVWRCITTTAFEAFVSANDIAIGAFRDANPDTQQIREQIHAAQIPMQVIEDISAISHELFSLSASAALAVRSSATVEDSATTAFAGQFDTFLGLTDIQDIVRSVKDCWASLWSDRAVRYLTASGLAGNPSMAVVLQDFIPADVSGVMFTVNPATRSADEIVIESTWGLGETIVGGKVTPDNYVVLRPSGNFPVRLAGSRIGSKRIALRWDRYRRALSEDDTSSDMRRSFSLTEQQVMEIAAMGMTLQSAFGRPLDVEWALYEGNFYVLQARPITTL